MPNIIEQQDQVMGLSKEALINYAQNPSGALPMFLVVERIKDLGDQEKRFLAQQEQPQGTVSEQIVAEATAPQGIGALQPQMQPGASGGAMPPSNAMPQPPMPPEMIAAQMNAQSQMMAATGGRMPYPAMAGGGVVPPNSLVEDASKFNPQSMYDMDPSQMAMAKPTNMGIASVLPMSGGGVVRMQGGGFAPYQAFKDKGGDALDWIVDQYTDEDGTTDWSKVAKDAVLMGLTFTPAGMAARGVQLAGGLGKLLLRSKKAQTLASNLMRNLPQYRKLPETAMLKGGESARAAAQVLTTPITKFEWPTRLLAGWGLADPLLDPQVAPGSRVDPLLDPQVAPGSKADAIAFILENQNNQTNELSGGGVIRMREGSLTAIDDTQQPVPTNMTDAEIALHLQELKRQGHDIPANLERFLAPTRPRTDISNGSVTNYENMIRASEADIGRDTDLQNLIQPVDVIELPSATQSQVTSKPSVFNEGFTPVNGKRDDRDVRPRSPLSVNDRLLSMLSERMGTIENLLKTETSLPDYEALRANITEGVDDDVVASILTSIGKSIYEGKGLAGADVSEAQAIKQKMRDSLSALELAKAKGLSDKEIADLDRQLTAQTSMLASIPAPQRSINPLTGRTTLGKLQYELAEMKARDPNDPNIALHEAAIGRLTDPKAADEIMKLIAKMRVGKTMPIAQDDGSVTYEIRYGPEALDASDNAAWHALIEGNQSISDILTRDISLGL